MSRKNKLYLSAVVGTVFLVCAGLFYWHFVLANTISIDPEKLYPVTYVNDGDTFKVKINNHQVTVRMLGIDTPETVDPRKTTQCYGKEASDNTKSVLIGHSVHLKLNPNREVTDKYGRYLAYVYMEDGTFLNKSFIRDGFAREYTFGTPYSFQAEFVAAQDEAKKEKRGLWGQCPDLIPANQKFKN